MDPCLLTPAGGRFFFSLLLVILPLGVRGQALDVWHWRNPKPTGNGLTSIAFGNGSFVALDSFRSIFSSPDGISWTVQSSPVNGYLNSITFGDGKFVAAGEGGLIITSDGGPWTARTSGTTESLYNVAHGNGWFVAADGAGGVTRSSDGVNWTAQHSISIGRLAYLTFGSGVFVAIDFAFPNATNALVSVDGAVWTLHPISASRYGHYGLVHAFGKFYVTGAFPGPGGLGYALYASTDGVTWTRDFTTPRPMAVASGAGTVAMIADGYQYAPYTNLYSSTDGLDWTLRTSPAKADVRSIAFGNGVFVAVGEAGEIIRSTNGIDWVRISRGDRNFTMNAGADGAGKYVLAGDSIVTSPDGVTFNRIDGIAGEFRDVTSGGGTFVAVGGAGQIMRSTDGVVWTPSRSGTTQTLNSIAHGSGYYVAVGEAGTIRVSTDAELWISASSGTDYALRSVVYAQGKFVVVGDLGLILVSPDALTWIPQRNDDFNTLDGLAYGNGRFVAVSTAYTVLTSSDGSNWTSHTEIPFPLKSVRFGGGLFVATGDDGDGPMYSVFISTNGEHWVQQWFGHKVGGAAFVNNTFMLFGYNGIVLQSDPVGALMLNASRPNTGYFEVIARGGEVGRTYRLQSCIDLSTLSWTDLTTFTQTRDPTRIVIPTSPDSRQAYYRAISP